MVTLITISELAIALKVSKKTIYSFVSQNKIPYIKVGGALRFIWADIEKWLKLGNHSR